MNHSNSQVDLSTPSLDHNNASPNHQQIPQIAEFWHRFAAIIIDLELVSLFCFLIAWSFSNQLYSYPLISTLIGYALFVGYFGVFNSHLHQGQSIGKQLLKLRVVSFKQQQQQQQQQQLKLLPSLCRAALFSAPFCLYAFPITDQRLNLLLTSILIVISTLSLYLFLFNQSTRRSLHDYLSNSIVVQTEQTKSAAYAPLWKAHLLIAALTVALSLFIAQQWFKPTQFQPILDQTGFAEIMADMPKYKSIQAYIEPDDNNLAADSTEDPETSAEDATTKAVEREEWDIPVMNYEVQVDAYRNVLSPFIMEDFIQQLQRYRSKELQQYLIYYTFYTQFQFGPIFFKHSEEFYSQTVDGELKYSHD
ncbi:putative RDD family membrane protein YckC [Acinetobacter calcoaceticus]|uniref:Putative RDD family membrane protein YckC n=1 Tax=Acinetobacter calcoaceticus TaxID=471 RepID=A0A4R1Y2G1_ACICA|nr:putative RDD family membrane protein YckC [Acinetobacter calcoaceticus]